MPPDQPIDFEPIPMLLRLIVLAVICLAAWYALSPRRVFVIRFTPEGTRMVRGRCTPPFLSALEDLRRQAGLRRGQVVGTARQKHIRVTASRHLPPDIHQRIRNLWSVYG